MIGKNHKHKLGLRRKKVAFNQPASGKFPSIPKYEFAATTVGANRKAKRLVSSDQALERARVIHTPLPKSAH
jgi:hypothetical protein